MVWGLVVSRVSLRGAILAFVVLGIITVPVHHTAGLLSETDRSTNMLAAGSVNPTLSEYGPATENSTTDETDEVVNHTWEDYSHTNGSTDAISNTLALNNTNTTYAVTQVNLSLTYIQNDSGVNDLVDDSQATAETMNVTTFTYNGSDLLGTVVTDLNNNGRIDLDDLANASITKLDGIPSNETVFLTLELAGDSTQDDNIAGGDGIDFTLRVEYVAADSWHDRDTSRNNTVQYAS